jgi:hypothetical protein
VGQVEQQPQEQNEDTDKWIAVCRNFSFLKAKKKCLPLI